MLHNCPPSSLDGQLIHPQVNPLALLTFSPIGTPPIHSNTELCIENHATLLPKVPVIRQGRAGPAHTLSRSGYLNTSDKKKTLSLASADQSYLAWPEVM